MYSVELNSIFHPINCSDLIRLGKDFDGGYLVCRRDIEKSDAFIGMGVSDDWSFESDFYKLKKIQIDTYDRSVGFSYFLRQIFRKLLRLHNPMHFLKAVRTLFSFLFFFGQESVRHHRAFIGFDAPPKSISLKSALAKSDGNVFLKIDIEGSEYRILDELLACAHRISGLAIEFHDCDLHFSRLRDFIDAFPLTLVHCHVNTGGVLGLDQDPTLLELTFSSSEKGQDKVVALPHHLDMPNKEGAPQFQVEFTGGKGFK